MTGIVIVGAGECGVRAAFALRELGYQGALTLIGDEKALPYERPPLSKKMQQGPKAIRSESEYVDAAIDLKVGAQVVKLNKDEKELRLSDGATIRFEKLLIASGAQARVFPGMEGCLTLRNASDAQKIAEHLQPGARVGIVGGGFIGLELAATARTSGAEVTVVEVAPRILGRAVPEEIAEVVRARHVAAGVEIITGTGVSRAGPGEVVLSDGRTLEFDAVIAGVGAEPNTQIAVSAELVVENGIVVDPGFRTSVPDIFAAGDCCSFEWRGKRVRLESWKAAQDQGAFVAASILGAQENYTKVPWFWSDQFDMTLQVAGLFDFARPIHRRKAVGDICLVFQCDSENRLSAAAGIGTGNSVAKDVRILEKLIERETKVDPALLVDASFDLKQLLRANKNVGEIS